MMGWRRRLWPSRRSPRWRGVGGHPSISQLKRWCFTSMSCTPSFSGFFSFSCRMTQRPGSVHHTQKRGGCVCRQPEHAKDLAPRQSSFLHFPPLHSWHRERPLVWKARGKGGACHFPLPHVGRAGRPLCHHCPTAPAAQPALARKAAPSTASGAGSRESREWAEAQSWEREAVK